jgi:catechol 2,3-dioxygenase-like lactoylglutathione lyase family enzyme
MMPRMDYPSVTHVALRVPGLRQAEGYYRELFGLEVAFREAPTAEGWRTLPFDAGWEEAETAGIELGLSVLRRDAFVVALEAADEETDSDHKLLSHIGLLVSEDELVGLRQRTNRLPCDVVLERDDLLILEDAHGVRWEITTSQQLRSNGEARGAWLEVRS